MTYRLTELRKL